MYCTVLFGEMEGWGGGGLGVYRDHLSTYTNLNIPILMGQSPCMDKAHSGGGLFFQREPKSQIY